MVHILIWWKSAGACPGPGDRENPRWPHLLAWTCRGITVNTMHCNLSILGFFKLTLRGDTEARQTHPSIQYEIRAKKIICWLAFKKRKNNLELTHTFYLWGHCDSELRPQSAKLVYNVQLKDSTIVKGFERFTQSPSKKRRLKFSPQFFSL